ncbi:cytochrome c [Seonamhaeicola sp.]|uniref:c-type cytochrome n=1 Tax=Seonamhaeicola sp. TaxID=1912245 RepID=UPI0026355512|nr:cytochrome c [Seonamhaeicola sp.]
MKKTYLLSLFTVLTVTVVSSQNSNQDTLLKESIERGSDIYTDFCINCHMPNGEGMENVYPPLANSDYLMKNREASIRGIKFGQEGELVVNGVTYNSVMAPMGLSDDEVADVMNYISNNWGNKSDDIVTEEEVSNIKK